MLAYFVPIDWPAAPFARKNGPVKRQAPRDSTVPSTSSFRLSRAEVVQGDQVRAARALLDWSISLAAEKCGIGINTINRFEKGHRPGVAIMQAIVDVFEQHGVLFIDSEVGPGVIRNDRLSHGAGGRSADDADSGAH